MSATKHNEIDAMQAAFAALDALPRDAQRRALRWLGDALDRRKVDDADGESSTPLTDDERLKCVAALAEMVQDAAADAARITGSAASLANCLRSVSRGVPLGGVPR